MSALSQSLQHPPLRRILRVLVLVGLYLLLANARSTQPNPLIPGAVISVAMIVPVAAGMLGGRLAGLATGMMGTLAAASVFALRGVEASFVEHELLSVVPHAAMGYLAGWLEERLPPPLPACSIAVGHLLNILFYWAFTRLEAADVLRTALWAGLAWETFIGVALASAAVGIYRMGFDRNGP